MSVRITEVCINCDACIDECPATAIVSANDEHDYTYVKPEKCIECVDSAVPKCADVCPTEGCIVWDMPYIAEYDAHFLENDDYTIRVHKTKGILSPAVQPRPWRESISIEQRQHHLSVGETLRLYHP